MDHEKVLQDLKEIFLNAVRRVDPIPMIRERLRLEGDRLFAAGEGEPLVLNLHGYDRILVVGAGKASARMAQAVEEILQDRIAAGLIAVKPGHSLPLKRIKTIEAGHPIPDAGSVRASREVMELCRSAGEGDLILCLISGGGSALLCCPQEPLSLEEKQEATRRLLACGATIQELNCIRKHLSGIKGGRLARLMAPATSVSLILSDVVGDRLDAIASGPTAPDPTTYADAGEIVRRYDLEAGLPPRVRDALQGAYAPETPKPGDAVFNRVHNLIIGSNRAALLAARDKAESLGYRPLLLSSRITGEAREVAKLFLGMGRDALEHGFPAKPPFCLLAGGETTVTLRGDGRGGRNQEMALSFLAELSADPAGAEGLAFLAASTDGSDGPTDAAGAFASVEILQAAARKDLSPREYLKRNDSYAFFERSGYLLKTGPTQTNVCDLQILIAG